MVERVVAKAHMVGRCVVAGWPADCTHRRGPTHRRRASPTPEVAPREARGWTPILLIRYYRALRDVERTPIRRAGPRISRSPAARKEVAMVSCSPSIHPETKVLLRSSLHHGGTKLRYKESQDESKRVAVERDEGAMRTTPRSAIISP